MATKTIDINALPYVCNVDLRVGDSYRKLWTLQRQTDASTTAAVSLTSVTWTLKVADYQGGTSTLSKTNTTTWTSSGVHVDTAASGTFSVYLLAEDVTTIGVGRHYYEVEATFPAAHLDFPSMVKTLIAGTLHVTDDA